MTQSSPWLWSLPGSVEEGFAYSLFYFYFSHICCFMLGRVIIFPCPNQLIINNFQLMQKLWTHLLWVVNVPFPPFSAIFWALALFGTHLQFLICFVVFAIKEKAIIEDCRKVWFNKCSRMNMGMKGNCKKAKRVIHLSQGWRESPGLVLFTYWSVLNPTFLPIGGPVWVSVCMGKWEANCKVLPLR